ncbi:MAG: GHKL domain-containing protein [Clostridium sp.]|nr:GHKL domain-containing protein [Clostridium sp.]
MNDAKLKETYELRLKMYQNQLELLRKDIEASRDFRHDMKHHIIMLADYLHREETGKALEYLEKMGCYTEKSGDYIETGNGGIDCALNYMIARVKKQGGQASAKVCLAPNLAVDDFDISIILGNLLLNAEEAMEKCARKELDIFISYDRGLLHIRIRNTYDGILVQEQGKLLTTKADVQNHGRGLASVKKAVKKYGGHVKIRFDGEFFQADVVMYLIPPSC